MTIVKYFENIIPKYKQTKVYISQYYRERAAILSGNGFDPAIVFGESKRKGVLNTMGVDVVDFDRYKRQHELLKRDFEVSGDALNLSLLVMSVVKKDDDLMDFIALRMFSSYINKYFRYGLDSRRLDFTLSQLDSSWDIIKYSNILENLNATMTTVRDTYKDRTKRLNDEDIVYVINQISSRVNDKVKKVSQRYYANEKAFYKEKERLDSDELRHTTTETLKFDSIVKAVKHDIITNGLDVRLLKQVKGINFKNDMVKLHKHESKILCDITSMLIDNYMRAYPSVSMVESRTKFITYSVTNKRRGEISKLISVCISKYNIKYGSKFQPILIKYLSMKLHNRIVIN